jgi:hypothetical protein
LLRVLQVKQCEAKINKTLQYYLTKRKYHTRVAKKHQECTKNTKRSSKASLYCSKEWLQNCNKITFEKWERVRESGENFWYNGVVVKTSCQNEEKGLPFKGGKRRDPSLMSCKCHPSKRERTSQGGTLLGF